MDTRHSQHAGWPDMMKTWIGPSWTGSGSGFIDEFATPKQVSISSAIMVRLHERKVGLTQHSGGAGGAAARGLVEDAQGTGRLLALSLIHI